MGERGNSADRVERLGTGSLVRQYLWQRYFQLLQVVAQRTGRHPRFARRLFHIDLPECHSDRLDFFIQLPYPVCRGLPPGETLIVAHGFYQKQPIFVKAQPTNISNISQLREPSPICIVSWQAPHTLGRRLADREKHVKIFGEGFTRRAEIATIGGLSAHAGQDLLVEYALAVKAQVKKVFLVHGEALPAMALKGKLAENGLREVYYPELHSSVEI